MIRNIACILLIVLLANTLSYAQGTEIPMGRWNKVEAEQPGTGIIVTMHDGEVITCFLKSIEPETLTVLTEGTQQRVILKRAVATIFTREKRSGPLWNGAVLGAAIPAAILTPVAIASHDKNSIGAVLFVSGLGALIGVGIDAACRGQVTLYRAKTVK